MVSLTVFAMVTRFLWLWYSLLCAWRHGFRFV